MLFWEVYGKTCSREKNLPKALTAFASANYRIETHDFVETAVELRLFREREIELTDEREGAEQQIVFFFVRLRDNKYPLFLIILIYFFEIGLLEKHSHVPSSTSTRFYKFIESCWFSPSFFSTVTTWFLMLENLYVGPFNICCCCWLLLSFWIINSYYVCWFFSKNLTCRHNDQQETNL